MKKSSFLLLAAWLAVPYAVGCAPAGTVTTLAPVTTTTRPIPAVTNTAPLPWTIMVYLCADNNLEEFAMEDFNEMEVASTASSLIDVIVLIDRSASYDASDGNWSGTRLYKIRPDADMTRFGSTRLAGMGLTNAGDSDELNLSDTNTLRNFVAYCQTNYPNSNTMLIVWDHGDGWKDLPGGKKDLPFGDFRNPVTRMVCEDDGSGGTVMFNSDMSRALTNLHVDVLAFDACLMGMFEVAYEFAGFADYLIASPELEPGDGYPYEYWLANFANTSGAVSSLYTTLIDAYAQEYRYFDGVSLSAYDLTKCGTVMTALDAYAGDLLAATNDWLPLSGYTNLAEDDYGRVLGSGQFYGIYSGVNYHLDPYNLADKVAEPSSAALKTALDGFVLYEWHNVYDSAYTSATNAHGLALFFPDPMGVAGYYYAGSYTNFNRFNAQSRWTDYVRAFLDFPPYEIVGPAKSGAGSMPEDSEVLFQYEVLTPGSVIVRLQPGAGCDDDLSLYYRGQAVAYSWTDGADAPEVITNTAAKAGFYVIRVNRYAGSASPEFSVTVTEGTADVY